MSLKIERVSEGSIGEVIGIRPGDQLVEINGHSIHDVIDFQYYSADDVIDCVFLRKQKRNRIRIQKKNGDIFGFDFEQMRIKSCGNKCIFCFVDQNPLGMRKSIYFKDEDYRLSFLHGNYVTLTQVSQKDLERIAEQRLSPLYVSIHAADSEVRKYMLGLKQDDNLMKKIHFLTGCGIELHGQIVLCPGINDGNLLEESLETLSSFFPGLRSVAVVPVGLTHHRQNLPKLKKYDSDSSQKVLESLERNQREFQKKIGESFVYLADEFYLLCDQSLPISQHYREFWQIENGVGLTRSFLKGFKKVSERFPKRLNRHRHIVIVTGVLAEPIIRAHIVPRLREIKNLEIDVQVIRNRFYGESVTVSGLLVGNDIIDTFRGKQDSSVILLPPNCLNVDGFFLDNLSISDLARELKRDVLVLEEFDNLWKRI